MARSVPSSSPMGIVSTNMLGNCQRKTSIAAQTGALVSETSRPIAMI